MSETNTPSVDNHDEDVAQQEAEEETVAVGIYDEPLVREGKRDRYFM